MLQQMKKSEKKWKSEKSEKNSKVQIQKCVCKKSEAKSSEYICLKTETEIFEM